MNKLCYRIVFNKVRGLLMVVGETARSSGKGVSKTAFAGAPTALQSIPRLGALPAAIALGFSVSALLVSGSAGAQVVADPGAPGGQRPTVLMTANEVIQVNIQSASAAGVSRNTYSQFDVPKGGVILNNSRVDTQTQTGGWVQGNPWLANGSARVILNEVNSTNPSRLQGYIEVAGQRAEVIVANPAGISVDGGGFINASRAILTTGSPHMTDGRLDGFTVSRGHISIDGSGLDASTADYATLIARSVAINGALWAQQVNVSTGSGEFSIEGGVTAAGRGDGTVPSYGIDVSHLGGMYANKIFLVGSEAGVGVRNAGEIGAAAGELVVTADGRLENSGSLGGKQQVQLTADAVENTGTLAGDAGVTMTTGSLRNSGLIQSAGQTVLTVQGNADNSKGTIQAQRIELTSAHGAILNRGGNIQQSGSTALDIVAPSLLNAGGGQVGSPVPAAAPGGSSGGATGSTGSPAGGTTNGTTPSPAETETGSTAPPTGVPSVIMPNGLLRADQSIDNTGGQITAGGLIGLQVGAFDNTGGKLYLRDLSFSGNMFSNRDGLIDVTRDFRALTPVFDNTGGQLLVGGTFDGALGQFTNTRGLLQAQQVQIRTVLDADNTGGTIRQTGHGATLLEIGGSFNNEKGTLDSAGDIDMSAAAVTGSGSKLGTLGNLYLDSGRAQLDGAAWNIAGTARLQTGSFTHSGVISAGKDLFLTGGPIHNNGSLLAASALTISASEKFDNAGAIGAGSGMFLSADGGLNNSGAIESGGGLRIDQGTAFFRNSGTLVASGPLQLTAASIDNDAGQIATAKGSGAGVELAAGSLSNRVGKIVADGSATIAVSGAADNGQGLIQAGRDMQFSAAGVFGNKDGIVEALGAGATLSVTAGSIDNGNGRIVNVGTGLTKVAAETTLFSNGTIAGNGEVLVAAQTLDNAGGTVSAAGTLNLAVTDRLANQGVIGSKGAMTLRGAGATVENAGTIDAGGALTLDVARIVNQAGHIVSGADLTLAAAELSNKAGAIAVAAADSRLQINADVFENLAGRIENAGSGATGIAIGGSAVNSGVVAAHGALALSSSVLDNRADGTIVAGEGLDMKVRQELINAGTIGSSAALELQAADATVRNSGNIVAESLATISAGILNNDSGQIATAAGSGADLVVTAGSLSNQDGTIVADHDANIIVDAGLDNDQGKLQAGNELQLSAGAALSNVNGVIEDAGQTARMRVTAESIDNTGGRIVNAGSGAATVVARASLLNSGVIGGNGALILNAERVENNVGGSVSSGADLDLGVTRQFSNLGGSVSSVGALRFNQDAAWFTNSGAIVSGGATSIQAARIDNNGGRLTTLDGSGAAISLRGTDLSNRSGHIIADGSAGIVLGGAFDNTGGILQAGDDLQLAAGGSLDNDAGSIEALGASSSLVLNAQALANGSGRISNLGVGETRISSQGTLANNGLIAGNGRLALDAAQLRNEGEGRIGAGGDMELGVRQQLDNAGKITSGGKLNFNQAESTFINRGEIASNGSTVVSAAVINNDGGQISTVKGTGSDILLGGQLSNRSGKILADGNASLSISGNLDNTGGTLQAGKDISLSLAGGLINHAGVVEALGAASALTAQAQWIDNGNGRIANVGNRETRLSGSSIASSGSIGGNGDLVFNGQTLSNLGGSISAGGKLDLAVWQQLENRGTISSAGTLTFQQAGANFINSGKVTAGGDAVITANQLINNWGQIGADGDLSLSSQVLGNEGGRISAGRDLRVATRQVAGIGDFYSGRDLFMSMEGDYAQTDNVQRFHSQRDLSLTLSGNFVNAATFEAVRNLNLSANQVTNQAGAMIRAEDLTITSAGGVNNAGEINGQGKLTINAGGNVDNSSGIVGGHVTVTAQNLNNTGVAALVGATDGMTLAVRDQITNAGGATIYSAGNLSASAGALNNYSSTVEAAGNLDLAAGTVNNVRENIAIVQNTTLDETRRMVLPSWYRHGDNRNYYDPNSANYRPLETYFVNPADIIEDATFITPDGYTIGRVVYRSHANDSAFFGAGSGLYGKYGHRERIATTEGTQTLYYLVRENNVANPDQGGPADNGNPYFGSTTMLWNGPPVTFSNQYGSCSADCIRFITLPDYDDPVNTISLTNVRELAPNWNKLEVWRDAHHVVVEDSLAAGAGAAAQIRSGGNMHLTVSQHLNNQFGEIIATGYLGIDGAGTRTNQSATLYRNHNFDGRWRVEDGTMATYTMPTISEVIGTVGGVISGGQGVSITGRSFSNVDVTAGTAGIVRTSVQVLGSGTTGATSAGSGASTSGAGNAAGLSGLFGGSITKLAAAALAGASPGNAGNVAGAQGNGPAGVLTAGLVNAIKAGGSGGTSPAPVPDNTARQPEVLKFTPGGLFTKNPDVNAKYLLETRPQFANRENWASSDYLLQQLGNDPALTQKRLGDGFYEQRMVREQLAQLTGRPPQDGASDDSRYQQLLNNAVSVAREYDLRPGIALTGEQVSRLTSDIVWMESQQVSLPDGSVETVLVPKVYLAHVGSDAVKQSGALVTGAGVYIDTEEDIVNRGGVIDGGAGRTLLLSGQDILNEGGTIRGSDVLLAAERDIRNESLTAKQTYANGPAQGSYTSMSNQSSIQAGGTLEISAGRDLTDIAGKISAGDAAITAGRDVKFDALATGSTYQHAIGEYVQNDSTVKHEVSQLASSGDLVIAAGRDLGLNGARLDAGGSGALLAGRTLALAAVTDEVKTDQHNNASSKRYDKRIHENQSVVGSSLAAGGDLQLRAGLNETASLNVSGSGIAAGGAVSLGATGDVNIGGVQENHLLDFAHHSESRSTFKKSSTTSSDYVASSTVIGSSISGGSVDIDAANDIKINASELVAEKTLTLAAGRDLAVTSAVQVDEERHSSERKKSGFSLSAADGVGYSKSNQQQNSSVNSTTQLGSTLSGESVVAIAGRDLSIQASNVVADGNIALAAARDLSILSARNTQESESASRSKKSGFIGTAWQPAIGTVKTTEDGTSHSITQAGSQVGSIGGNVSIEAGERYTQTASGVLAQGGDIAIHAKDVLINAANDTSDSTSHSTFSKVALGGTVNIPVVSAVQSAISLASAAKESGNDRMKALAAMTAAANASDTIQNVTNNNVATGIKVSVSLGSTKSESNMVQTSSTAVGSQVLAGGDVSIVATGAGKASNITSVGSEISAGGSALLRADNQVNLLAAENTYSQHSTNKSSGASIGIGFAFGGSQQGFTLELAASQAKGRADGDDLSYTNSHVSAGNKVELHSGGDTTLKGGVITAGKVVADIGGDLKIESLQDRSTYDSKQTSAGFNASICIPPFCYGASTVGGSVSKSAVNGDFLSVVEQSGIKAGDGGFQLAVGGSTDLVGGVISSSQSAIDDKKNRLATASLTYSMLQNKDVYEASGFAVSGSVSADVGSKDEKAVPSPSGGFASDSGSQHSVTQSGISAGELVITDGARQAATGTDTDTLLASLKRDVTTDTAAKDSGALTQAWNGEKLMQEMQAQTEITQAFFAAAAPIAAKTVGDIATSRQDAAKRDAADFEEAARKANAAGDTELAAFYTTKQDEALAAIELWSEKGAYRVGLHAAAQGLVGAAGGGSGALGSVAGVMGGNYGRELGKTLGEAEADKLNLTGDERDDFIDTYQQTLATIGGGLGGLAGGAVAGQSGTALANTAAHAGGTGSAVDLYNRQLHDKEKKKLAELKEGKSLADQRRLDDAACYLTQCAAGLSDANPEKAARLAQQQRGAQYTTERLILKESGLFEYGWSGFKSDLVSQLVDDHVQLGKAFLKKVNSVGNSLFPAKSEPLVDPWNLPIDFGEPKGPNAGGGAVLVVPMPACPSPVCLIASVPVGGVAAPPSAIFSVDGGNGSSTESTNDNNSEHNKSGDSASKSGESPVAAPNRVYSARELARRAEEPGPMHNFPESMNAEIFNGKKTKISDTYTLYTKEGTLTLPGKPIYGKAEIKIGNELNNPSGQPVREIVGYGPPKIVEGTYEIGVRPSASGRTETITHRFFRPKIKK